MKSKQRSAAKRNILTFEPTEPASGIIARELADRGKRGMKAPLRKLIEEAVLAHFGPRYPKLIQSTDATK